MQWGCLGLLAGSSQVWGLQGSAIEEVRGGWRVGHTSPLMLQNRLTVRRAGAFRILYNQSFPWPSRKPWTLNAELPRRELGDQHSHSPVWRCQNVRPFPTPRRGHASELQPCHFLTSALCVRAPAQQTAQISLPGDYVDTFWGIHAMECLVDIDNSKVELQVLIGKGVQDTW